MSARPITEASVVVVYENIMNLGVQEARVVFFMFLEDLQDVGGSYDAASGSVFIPLDGIDTDKEYPGLPFHPICGQHTCVAFTRHHARKPNHKPYKVINANYLIVASRTDGNIYFAKQFGQIDNKVLDARKKTDVWDVLWNLHQTFVDIESKGGNSTQIRDAKKIAKTKVEDAENIPSTTMGTYATLANSSEEVWSLIEKIFNGDVHHAADEKKFTPPTALTAFKNMGGISDDWIVEQLTKVIYREQTLKNFQIECDRYKTKVKIQKHVVDVVNQIKQKKFEDYSDLCNGFPAFNDPEWFQHLFDWVGTVSKSVMQTRVVEQVQKKLKWIEKQATERDEMKQVPYFIIIICVLSSVICVFYFLCVCHLEKFHGNVLCKNSFMCRIDTIWKKHFHGIFLIVSCRKKFHGNVFSKWCLCDTLYCFYIKHFHGIFFYYIS